ncbi:hypothetical protein L6452_44897 [Arctium lappa]|nr:hypothetical protein L6452_44897 [Arctium lappa]
MRVVWGGDWSPCPWCGWPKKESPLTDARVVVVVKAFVSSRADAREALSNDPNVSSCNDASTATPADGGRRCVSRSDVERREPVRQSTRGRGPVRIGAAAKARAVDMPVEMPSRRSWLAARAVTACPRHLRAPGHRPCGHPIRPVLKHGPRSLTCSILRDGGSPSDSAFRASFERESGLKFLNRDVAADGNVRESGDVGGGLGKSYLFCLTACPPWNRLSRSSGRWNNVGKGSRQNGSVTSGKGLALRAGHGGPSPEPVGCRRTARAASRRERVAACRPGDGLERPLRGPSRGPSEQPTQNWYGQGESDCLIKTKHCDGPCGCLTQCDFCPVL